MKVGLYILNLGKLDISTGAFTVDFYLSLKSDQNIGDPSFEFMNGRAATIDKVTDAPKEKFYRIQANLSTPVDLRQYPFDTQKMQIIIEDKTATLDSLRYVKDDKESGIDKDIVFPGWNILGGHADVAEHNYPVYGEKYSQYVYTAEIGRISMNSFLKTFLPVLFLMLIVMSSFILDPDKVTTRLAAISSALVASAMFHISISSQIPPVGYLTFADKFMVATYLILLVSFLLSIYIYVLQGRQDTARAMRIHHFTEKLVFVFMPALYVILFLFFR